MTDDQRAKLAQMSKIDQIDEILNKLGAWKNHPSYVDTGHGTVRSKWWIEHREEAKAALRPFFVQANIKGYRAGYDDGINLKTPLTDGEIKDAELLTKRSDPVLDAFEETFGNLRSVDVDE